MELDKIITIALWLFGIFFTAIFGVVSFAAYKISGMSDAIQKMASMLSEHSTDIKWIKEFINEIKGTKYTRGPYAKKSKKRIKSKAN